MCVEVCAEGEAGGCASDAAACTCCLGCCAPALAVGALTVTGGVGALTGACLGLEWLARAARTAVCAGLGTEAADALAALRDAESGEEGTPLQWHLVGAYSCFL
jgi:hypothetical protein